MLYFLITLRFFKYFVLLILTFYMLTLLSFFHLCKVLYIDLFLILNFTIVIVISVLKYLIIFFYLTLWSYPINLCIFITSHSFYFITYFKHYLLSLSCLHKNVYIHLYLSTYFLIYYLLSIIVNYSILHYYC